MDQGHPGSGRDHSAAKGPFPTWAAPLAGQDPEPIGELERGLLGQTQGTHDMDQASPKASSSGGLILQAVLALLSCK